MASHLATSAGTRATFRFLLLSLVLIAVPPARSQAQGEATSLSASFRRAAERVLPSVVAVRSTLLEDSADPNAPFSSRTMGPAGAASGFRRVISTGGGASGVVVDSARGMILTSQQALGGGGRAVVSFTDGRQMETDRVARDPRSDLALIWINPQAIRLKAAEWSEAEAPPMGEWVVAVGRPQGRSHLISAGIVSGRGPLRSSPGESDGLWTDAVTGGANAGGALVDLEGRVVGINVSPSDVSSASGRFGQAIPAETARRFLAEMSESGQVRRGYLGLTIGNDAVGPVDQGIPPALVITAVTPGSPAEASGFLVGDRLVAVDGSPIVEVEALSRVVENAPVGRKFRLTITRGGASQDIAVNSAARPDSSGIVASRPSSSPRTIAPSRPVRSPVRQAPAAGTGSAAGQRSRGTAISEDLPKELNPISGPSEEGASLPPDPDEVTPAKPRRSGRGATSAEPRPSAEPAAIDEPQTTQGPRQQTIPAPEAKPQPAPAPVSPTPRPDNRPAPPSKPSTDSAPKEEKKPTPDLGPKPEVKPAPLPETTPKPEGKPAPGPGTAPNPEGKPAPKPETTPKPEGKPAPKPETTPKPEVKPEVKPAPSPAPETKPKADSKPESKPVPAPDPLEVSPLPPPLEPAPPPAPSAHLEAPKGPSGAK